MTMIHRFLVPLSIAMTMLLPVSTVARAGTMSSGPSAPVIDGQDIANDGAASGTDKWWSDNNTNSGSAKGQTFTTGAAAVEFRSISYQVSDSHQAEPTKTYVVRVGTVSGTTFSEIHSETFTQQSLWNAGEYMTWSFDTPPVLLGHTTYAVDIGLTSSTSDWRSGIPYINMTANDYVGGHRYTSGQSGVGDSEMHADVNRDRIFHLDLGVPAGSGFEFVAGTPADDSTDALVPPTVVGTFNQNLSVGTGDITIRNLSNSTESTVAVTDPRVTISGNLLMIATPGLINWNTSYAIRIDPGALQGDAGAGFAGISDDSSWNFTTASSDPLLDAIASLEDHINGVFPLSDTEIAAHKLTIDLEKGRFDQDAATIAAVFNLVETYDTVIGPLWVARGRFRRDSQPDDLDWTIYHVMQHIMDVVYHAGNLATHETTLDGFRFGSAANFPGSAPAPADPDLTHTATINGSFPDTFGRHTQGWTLPARKPTGCYLAPGTIATVTVPSSLVDRGFKVRVGAHSWDLSNRPWVERLDRSTLVYELDAPSIKVASPLGGGIYVEVPFLADAGVVEVSIRGAIRSPFFSAKSIHTTTLDEWTTTERHHDAPWADFQTDKFMMQVPTDWIYALDDPVSLMADWDAAMDAMNDLMGFPRLRGKETMYPQVDLIMRSSVHAPGYPAVNTTYNPDSSQGGHANNHLVRGPRTGWHTEFHEQGHAYFFPKFSGESESNVNLLHTAIWHRKFDYPLDYAFAGSFGFEGNPHRTLDNTAVTWMTVFNFSPREVPMASAEKAYQLKGHAKFADLARLFGWEGLDAFWYSYNLDAHNGESSPTGNDGMVLRLCQSIGWDVRPLLHFWGIHPDDDASLEAAIGSEGLVAPAGIYELLHHYKSLVPADNADFRTFALGWWGKQPSINGYWTEREHARQWDTSELFSAGDQQRPNGEVYTEESAADIRDRVQEIINIYYPSDYHAWAARWPDIDLGDPAADHDGDGISNDEERIWGLDPDDSASRAAISAPLDGAGTLRYTRRDDALGGLTYTIWTSTDLETWTEDTGSRQDPDADIGRVDGVETINVTLSPHLLTGSQLFVRISASQ